MNTNYMSQIIARAMRVIDSHGVWRVVSVYDRRWLVQRYQQKDFRWKWVTESSFDGKDQALAVFQSKVEPKDGKPPSKRLRHRRK